MKSTKVRWWTLVAIAFTVACSDSPSEPRSGSLAVAIAGLPSGAENALTITGPSGSGFSRTIGASETFENLTPGVYTIVANVVSDATGIYEPATVSQQVEITARPDPALVTVTYTISTGSIALNVTGLPQGADAAIAVTGPGGYYRQVTASSTLTRLTPGSYAISTGSVSATNGHVYAGVPLQQTINVPAAETPRSVNARYDLATGSLEVSITGLPAQQGGSVTVTGPGGYTATLTATTTLPGLFPGTYAVVASPVAVGTSYAPNPPSQSVPVTASLTAARATVVYVESNQPPPAQFNLTIDGLYITQAVQNYAGTVPLLAGMPALLRVFVKASAPNTVAPTVRLRVFDGSTVSETITLLPNVPSVPTTITEGEMRSSWNAMLPVTAIKPGLRVLVDVDPANSITESDETDNIFPRDGTPLAPRVEFTAPLNVTVVPVSQTSTGLTANVSLANADDYLAFARKVLPVRDYRVTVHETFTTSAPPAESNNGNNAWLHILGEVNTLRVAEGTSDYYMGFIGTTYNSGVAGMAFTPGRASLAWDKLPSASPVAAHELAHSLGRLHAPCGGVASPDSQYPYPLGTIGVWGYDISVGALKSPGTSDLMGYCGYGWISDYNYVGILNYRLNTTNAAVMPGVFGQVATESFVQAPAVRKSLVVWGRVEEGKLILEPAFTANTRSVLPAGSGPYRIEGRSAQGTVLFSYAFEGERPADIADLTARQFAFAIPVEGNLEESLVTIALVAQSGSRVERRVGAAAMTAQFQATRDEPASVTFRLDDARVPLAVVRDRATQQIVAFVRPGRQSVRVRTRSDDFEVQLSDGVRSITRSIRAGPR